MPDPVADGPDAKLIEELPRSFDELPADRVVRAFGVRYGVVSLPDGGELYVTRHGWPFLAELLPDRWYTGARYAREGTRLPGSTGHVYRLDVDRPRGRPLSLVIKFSRVAQHVPIILDTTFPDGAAAADIAEARFNSPLEEFGLVEELREGAFAPRASRVHAQRPLAIHVPAETMLPWQSGRTAGQFETHSRMLAADQEDAVKAIELDIARLYVLLYRWIGGDNAEVHHDRGNLDEDEFHGLAGRVACELRDKGFRVIDNKPKHYILRMRNGSLLRDKSGELVYGLVDFELLQRTREYQQHFQQARRTQYREQGTCRAGESVRLPSHLSPARIFGVDYLYGIAPQRGRLWVRGSDPGLFDFFLPERWRRTPRTKLAPAAEIYRTRTRDGIEVVYRRSNVGTRPRVDPLQEGAIEARQFGFNSPFEEVAIAERVAQMGIPTVTPRAIFRTGHQSTQVTHLRSGHAYETHADLRTPGAAAEPILEEGYDYYTIWDCHRGLPPRAADGFTGLALPRAQDEYAPPYDTWKSISARAAARFEELGLPREGIEQELSVFVDGDGTILLDESGHVVVVLTLDGIHAYEYGFLDVSGYQRLVKRLDERLRAIDFVALNLSGQHLLLTVTTDGKPLEDEHGYPCAVLSNFERIRGLYRPIR